MGHILIFIFYHVDPLFKIVFSTMKIGLP
jgi:hypothetical protein